MSTLFSSCVHKKDSGVHGQSSWSGDQKVQSPLLKLKHL